MRALEAIKIGSNLLKENKIPSHILDSEILLSKTLGKSREEILINLEQKITKKNISIFKTYLQRRSKNEPIAYILEEKEFWSKKFKVSKDTLIPRPETELLIDKLLKIYRGKKISILDIGTGSGCIIISLLSSLTKSIGIGVDISKNAISVAKNNAFKYKQQGVDLTKSMLNNTSTSQQKYLGGYSANSVDNPWKMDNPYSKGEDDIRWLL